MSLALYSVKGKNETKSKSSQIISTFMSAQFRFKIEIKTEGRIYTCLSPGKRYSVQSSKTQTSRNAYDNTTNANRNINVNFKERYSFATICCQQLRNRNVLLYFRLTYSILSYYFYAGFYVES